MAKAELAAILATLRERKFDPQAREAVLRAGLDRLGEGFALPAGIAVERVTLAGLPTDRLTAKAGGPIVLFYHGGGYVTGSSASHRHVAALLAQEIGGEVYLPNYRLAPEAPFPAALDDALAAYRDLASRDPHCPIVLVGDSAGGGLVFAVAVAAREAGLPTPAGLVGMSPWVNLGVENESYEKLASVDPMLSARVTQYYSERYLAGRPVKDPAASPLFADLSNLPPTLIQVGDHEVFFGDAVRLHQALICAGVDSELSVWKRMFHVWQLYWPVLSEGRAAIEAAADFIRLAGQGHSPKEKP